MVLNDDELTNVTGGAVKYGLIAIIGGIITFIIGVVDGYLRPLPCNR